MLKKFILGTAIATPLLFIYGHINHPLAINGLGVKRMFSTIYTINDWVNQGNMESGDLWAKNLLHILIKYQLLHHDKDINNRQFNLSTKIIEAGFDLQGNLLDGLTHIGMGGVQIGPVSFKQAEDNSHLGIRLPKANILTYMSDLGSSSHPLKIGVKIIPDDEVIQYTPYIIKQNLINCMNELIYFGTPNASNSKNEKQIINFIKIDVQEIIKQVDSSKQYSDITIKLKNDLLGLSKQSKISEKIQIITQNGSLQNLPFQYTFISWRYLIQQILKQ